MKRFCDVLMAVIGLAILLLPIILISVFLCVSGTIMPLFTQKRLGLNGKEFTMYKFKTMNDKTDGSGNLLSDDERITRIGNFLRITSLDELPSLWNVLRGDMAIVGPRPLLAEYGPIYSDYERQRHNVRPGITGWAQINGRNLTSWEERFKQDIWYVNNRNFLLDLKIIFLTLLKVLKRSGISAQGIATMVDLRDERGVKY